MISHRIAFPMLALLMLGANAQASTTEAFSHATWNELVSSHVTLLHQGVASQVDYRGMMVERKKLKRYLLSLEQVSRKTFDRWHKNDQLAFLLNAYNAWTVELILTKYPKLTSIKDLGSFFRSPWKKSFIPLLEETRSLDDIEHYLIRGSGRYNEPRIHFAANCASIGCPALLKEAFVGKRLEHQLDSAARKFLQDRSRNRLKGDELQVSSIFRWYRSDFEQTGHSKHSLAQYLASYREALGLTEQQTVQLTNGNIDIEFLDYDWHLNSVP